MTFKKGQSGNPGGRPKGKHLTTLLFEALRKKARDKDGNETDKTYEDLLIERILADAIKKGNTSLIHMIMGYIDGSPDQGIQLDVTTNGETLNTASSDILLMAKEISERLKAKKTK
jgi:hypothetical protein